jgi:hypothetical protein
LNDKQRIFPAESISRGILLGGTIALIACGTIHAYSEDRALFLLLAVLMVPCGCLIGAGIALMLSHFVSKRNEPDNHEIKGDPYSGSISELAFRKRENRDR